MKKLLGFVVFLLLLLRPIKINAMVIPSHSIIIGNVAYSMDYIVQPKHYDEINAQLLRYSTYYYVIKPHNIKDNSNHYVSPEIFKDYPIMLYVDKNGNKYYSTYGIFHFQRLGL